MTAPKKFDLFCEILPYLIAACILFAGGPSMMAAFLQQQGVSSDVALRFVGAMPWWLPVAGALIGGIAGIFLKMCYPSVQLPTSANQAAFEALAQEWLSRTQPQVTVQTPNLGPEHPSTTVTVAPAAASPTPPVSA